MKGKRVRKSQDIGKSKVSASYIWVTVMEIRLNCKVRV